MPTDDDGTGDLELHLIVRAGARRVALAMTALRAVVPAPPISRLPGQAAGRLGLVALEGEPVAVVALSALLGETTSASEQLLVVVDDGESRLALQVDGVEGHETLLPHLSARIDLSDSVTRSAAPLATAVGEDGLLVLDIDAALADPRLRFSDVGSGA